MEDGSILDDQITASSEWDQNHGPSNARLNRPATPPTKGAWTAKTNDLNQWIQVNLGGLKQVSGVVTQGRNGQNQWVRRFNVQYSQNGQIWNDVKDSNGQKVRKDLITNHLNINMYLICLNYISINQ